MRHFVGSDQFHSPMDRNGTKIHIGEEVLFLNFNKIIRGEVCGFTKNYKYVYIASTNDVLYKRKGNSIVIVHRLSKWRN